MAMSIDQFIGSYNGLFPEEEVVLLKVAAEFKNNRGHEPKVPDTNQRYRSRFLF